MKDDNITIVYALNKVESGDSSFVNLNAYSSDCEVKTELSFEFANIYKEHKLRLTCGIELLCRNNVFAKFSVKCYFDIDKASWIKLSENYTKDVTLPAGFVSHLMSICVSTTRGYVFAKTEDLNIDRQITVSLFDTDAFVKENFSDGCVIPKD